MRLTNFKFYKNVSRFLVLSVTLCLLVPDAEAQVAPVTKPIWHIIKKCLIGVGGTCLFVYPYAAPYILPEPPSDSDIDTELPDTCQSVFDSATNSANLVCQGLPYGPERMECIATAACQVWQQASNLEACLNPVCEDALTTYGPCECLPEEENGGEFDPTLLSKPNQNQESEVPNSGQAGGGTEADL